MNFVSAAAAVRSVFGGAYAVNPISASTAGTASIVKRRMLCVAFGVMDLSGKRFRWRIASDKARPFKMNSRKLR